MFGLWQIFNFKSLRQRYQELNVKEKDYIGMQNEIHLFDKLTETWLDMISYLPEDLEEIANDCKNMKGFVFKKEGKIHMVIGWEIPLTKDVKTLEEAEKVKDYAVWCWKTYFFSKITSPISSLCVAFKTIFAHSEYFNFAKKIEVFTKNILDKIDNFENKIKKEV